MQRQQVVIYHYTTLTGRATHPIFSLWFSVSNPKLGAALPI